MTPNLQLPDTLNAVPYRWPFVYLHGEAQKVFDYQMKLQDISAPNDIFETDQPMPGVPGLFYVNVYGLPAIANLQPYTSKLMRGRVVLLSDLSNHDYLCNPKLWM